MVPAIDHVDGAVDLRAAVDDNLRIIRAMSVCADSTRYLVGPVLYPKLLFRLRFARFDESTVDALQRDVTTLLLERVKLNPRVNRRVCGRLYSTWRAA